MLIVMLFMLVVLALSSGVWGYSLFGAVGVLPAAVTMLILLILWLTGHFHST